MVTAHGSTAQRARPGAEAPTGFALRDSSFRSIARLVHELTGIVLSDAKRSLVVARLGRRLRALGLQDFEAYLRLLEEEPEDGPEHLELVNCITTNKTDFFREPHHFDFLESELPALTSRLAALGERRLRVWSAACSSGEEPYTIAMVLDAFFASRKDWTVQILASDIDTDMLRRAQAARYTRRQLEPVPRRFRRAGIERARGQGPDQFVIRQRLRDQIVLRRIDLIRDPFRFRSPVDVIFCRNVLIYFDRPTRERIMQRFADVLRPGGLMFIGHSESLLDAADRYRFLGQSTYRRR